MFKSNVPGGSSGNNPQSESSSLLTTTSQHHHQQHDSTYTAISETTAAARPKILMLMSDTGGGHRASCKAIADALETLYPGKFEVKCILYMHIVAIIFHIYLFLPGGMNEILS